MALTVGSGNGNSHAEGFQNPSMQNSIYIPLTLTLHCAAENAAHRPGRRLRLRIASKPLNLRTPQIPDAFAL